MVDRFKNAVPVLTRQETDYDEHWLAASDDDTSSMLSGLVACLRDVFV